MRLVVSILILMWVSCNLRVARVRCVLLWVINIRLRLWHVSVCVKVSLTFDAVLATSVAFTLFFRLVTCWLVLL